VAATTLYHRNRVNSGCINATSGQSEWDQWLSEHGPKFLLFARQQTRFEVDAHDLVQEAVLECWRRQAIGAPPAAGLVFATIRRRAIDLGRREDRRAGREAAAAREAPEGWFDGSLEDQERNQLIQNAMKGLPEIYREVLTLKVWGELTFAEIAETLEIPANTAASRYRYGLAELRKLTKQVHL
jgi:RNA polymerase sigma-70 factor (ECF subfamily)